MSPRIPSARPRGLFVAVLLLLTLALAGVITLEANRTFLYHRATAERILHDYARLAAGRFGQRVAMELYYQAFAPGTEALLRAQARAPGGALPTPAALAAGLASEAADFVGHARYTFRYDLRSGRLETAGGAPSPAGRTWLRDTLPVHERTVYDAEEHVGAIVCRVDGVSRAIVYTVAKDRAGAPRTVLGFEGDPQRFEPIYSMGEDKFPLLPRPLTGGVIYDSLGSVVVADERGNELYRSPVQYDTLYAAPDSVEAMMGGMRVRVALRPDLAPKLSIGGIPRSPLPLLLPLLALTAGLIVAALLQLRREYELARLRADFVAGVSHELRTPLAQIRMFSETLLLGRVRSDEERERSLEIIDQEARRLAHLVENLLHISRSERRATRLALATAPLAPLVREVVEGFAPLAEARGMRLHTELAGEVVAPVDLDALRQVLLNLLDNAVKYGPPGQIVTVGLAARDGRVRLWVDDAGPGIPPADRERIWDRFWRLERDRGSALAGTGIGLAVVRELVALHGGRAWAEDAPHGAGGARFVIELPAARAEAAPRGAAPAGAGVPA